MRTANGFRCGPCEVGLSGEGAIWWIRRTVLRRVFVLAQTEGWYLCFVLWVCVAKLVRTLPFLPLSFLNILECLFLIA